jgi:sulfide:quinone oxidoreductase
MEAASPFRVVIAGGGPAALEAALKLKLLAAGRVQIAFVAPTPTFAYRPLSVAEPFGLAEVVHFSLRGIAAHLGAEFVESSLAAVDVGAQRVVLANGEELTFDALLVAVGSKPVEALPGALTFRGHEDVAALRQALDDLRSGLHRVAFVAAPASAWTLPLYELALMTARWATDQGLRMETWLVTHEGRALGVFGPDVAAEVAERLETAGVRLWTGAFAECVEDGRLWLDMEGGLPVDLAVALPRPMGRAIVGLPADEDGFVPVDAKGLVPDAPGVYAAGDATTRAMRQGGLATQQGDTAATAIAVQAGLEVEPETYRPVLRGMLLTGRRPQYLSRATGEEGHASDDAPWWPPHKIAGRHLAPYLAAHPELRETPVGHV